MIVWGGDREDMLVAVANTLMLETFVPARRADRKSYSALTTDNRYIDLHVSPDKDIGISDPSVGMNHPSSLS